MNTPLVQDICYSMLSRASQDRIAIGTTKLIKLLYLIDCEYFQWHRKTLLKAPTVDGIVRHSVSSSIGFKRTND